MEVMPAGWDEAKLRARFAQYGEVDNVTLADQLQARPLRLPCFTHTRG